MFLSQTVPLSDFSSIAEARRAGARMALSLGLNETKSGEMAIVITEAARNAVVYGGGGQLVLSGIKSKNETRLATFEPSCRAKPVPSSAPNPTLTGLWPAGAGSRVQVLDLTR